jgi:hypothetical protein
MHDIARTQWPDGPIIQYPTPEATGRTGRKALGHCQWRSTSTQAPYPHLFGNHAGRMTTTCIVQGRIVVRKRYSVWVGTMFDKPLT